MRFNVGSASTPTGPAEPGPPAPLLPVRRIRVDFYRSVDQAWTFEHEDAAGTPWLATYLPTRQHAAFGSLTAARRAAAGALLAKFHDDDTAAMTRPCPGGCGRPAAALVNTTEGPAPVCADHRPVIEARGYTTRELARP